MFVYIVDLGGLHDVADDEELCAEFCSDIHDLIQLATSDKCPIVWCVLFLDALHDSDSSVCRDE